LTAQTNPAIDCPLVLACDGGYSMQLATTLRSILEVSRSSWPLEIYILSNGFPESTKRRIVESQPAGACSIKWKTVDLAQFARFSTLPHISSIAYARLLIPSVLPARVSRALYLDADILVLADLAPLCQLDLQGAVAGAVVDERVTTHLNLGNRELNGSPLPSVRKYFNDGVLLIDVAKWRSERIPEKAMEYLEGCPDTMFGDQDALNFACDGHWKNLDSRWNFYQIDLAKPLADMIPSERPSIIHFQGWQKPWDAGSLNPNARFYDEFRSRTLFAYTPGERLGNVPRILWSRLKRFLRRFTLIVHVRDRLRSIRTQEGSCSRPGPPQSRSAENKGETRLKSRCRFLSMNPEVSVVIAAYKRVKQLILAVDSVLAQTVPVAEVIIIDDGSVGELPERIPHMIAENSAWRARVRYFWQENQGQSAARNNGILRAKGNWIAFDDSDDLWLPQKLEWQFRTLEKYSECGMCFTDAWFMNTSRMKMTLFQLAGASYSAEMGVIDDLADFARQLMQAWTQTMLARTDVVRRVMFDPEIRYQEDQEFMFRMALATKACYLNMPMVLVDRSPADVRHEDESLKWHQEEYRLRMKQIRFEKSLQQSESAAPRAAAIFRQRLRDTHSAWANYYVQSGDYRKAREAVSTAAKYGMSSGVAVKWLLTRIAPAALKAALEARDRNELCKLAFDPLK